VYLLHTQLLLQLLGVLTLLIASVATTAKDANGVASHLT
jgi:hypothetical protein